MNAVNKAVSRMNKINENYVYFEKRKIEELYEFIYIAAQTAGLKKMTIEKIKKKDKVNIANGNGGKLYNLGIGRFSYQVIFQCLRFFLGDVSWIYGCHWTQYLFLHPRQNKNSVWNDSFLFHRYFFLSFTFFHFGCS
jgi:hypothetical protein